MNNSDWSSEPPKEDGEYYYSGKTPSGIEIVGIVSIWAEPDTGNRVASILLPPGWRGDKKRNLPEVHFGHLHQWTGQWSGPEFGLCTCVLN